MDWNMYGDQAEIVSEYLKIVTGTRSRWSKVLVIVTSGSQSVTNCRNLWWIVSLWPTRHSELSIFFGRFHWDDARIKWGDWLCHCNSTQIPGFTHKPTPHQLHHNSIRPPASKFATKSGNVFEEGFKPATGCQLGDYNNSGRCWRWVQGQNFSDRAGIPMTLASGECGLWRCAVRQQRGGVATARDPVHVGTRHYGFVTREAGFSSELAW